MLRRVIVPSAQHIPCMLVLPQLTRIYRQVDEAIMYCNVYLMYDDREDGGKKVLDYYYGHPDHMVYGRYQTNAFLPKFLSRRSV